MRERERDRTSAEWECYYYCLKHKEHIPISEGGYTLCRSCRESVEVDDGYSVRLICRYKGSQTEIPEPNEFFRKRREEGSSD